MPITTKVVSSSPVHDEVYSIQHYVIKFVSDLRQGGGFLRILRFPRPINRHDIAEILLKVALNTIIRQPLPHIITELIGLTGEYGNAYTFTPIIMYGKQLVDNLRISYCLQKYTCRK